MIKRRVEIVSRKKEEEPYIRELIIDENGEEERHAKGYREFIKDKHLEYPGYEKEAGYTLAVYLISLGYLVFQGESTQISLIYLPETITDNQYEWYRKNKKILRRIKLAILDKNEYGLNNYDDSTLCGERAFDKLREIIEEKEIEKDDKDKGIRKLR